MATTNRRRLVMQHDNRLTIEEADALLAVLAPLRGSSPSLASAFRKIEHCAMHAKSRTSRSFGPGASSGEWSPPPLKLST